MLLLDYGLLLSGTRGAWRGERLLRRLLELSMLSRQNRLAPRRAACPVGTTRMCGLKESAYPPRTDSIQALLSMPTASKPCVNS